MMHQNRIVYRVFRHRFDEASNGLLEEVKEFMETNSMRHEFRHTSNQKAPVFSRFIKNTILMNSYKKDTEALSNSSSASLFFKLHFRVGTYSKALPQSFTTGYSACNDFEQATEERKSRTGFLQALLGRHPLHFINTNNNDDMQTDDRFNILNFILFDCPNHRSERIKWLTDLEHDFSLSPYNTNSNQTLLSVLKESTKPASERGFSNNIIQQIAFGGHSLLKKNGIFVVSRRDPKRLNVSAILARHTAWFLHSVYQKMIKHNLIPTHA